MCVLKWQGWWWKIWKMRLCPVCSELPNKYHGPQGPLPHYPAVRLGITMFYSEWKKPCRRGRDEGTVFQLLEVWTIDKKVDVYAASEMLLEKRGEKKACSTSLEMRRQKWLTVVLLTIKRAPTFCSIHSWPSCGRFSSGWEGHNLMNEESSPAWICHFLLRNASIRGKNGINF